MASNGGGDGARASVRPERHVPTGKGGKNGGSASVRTKSAPPKRPTSSSSVKSSADSDTAADAIRVRVAVRIRPTNNEDFPNDGDFSTCVELQPEVKKLRLKKNNWNSELYKFDEVFTEGASQRRVYEAVAKPVVESVLEGYNGTVMAYGQTGTGKTYTVGRLGKNDPSERGIMVRALEDIISSINPLTDSVTVSYLQLYLESVQDLLAPEKTNIPIVEDPKTGDVSLPGAALVEIRDIEHFNELVQVGETNRHAANTKLNTESSRSHAIMMVQVQRTMKEKEETENKNNNNNNTPIILKSKLLIVDLAGSERINKSGTEGHMIEEAKFINLSLTSLGKCINALAENSPHIPTRDSKLTRLLRDSFGGTARTSLIITIGPSARHYSETSSTIMFGQRAMKIVNTVKLKEEVDYENLYRKLEGQVDSLTSEIERLQKIRQEEKTKMEKKLKKTEGSLGEIQKNYVSKCEHLEKENGNLKMEMKDLSEELNTVRDQNNLLSNQVLDLEMSNTQMKQKQNENNAYKKALSDSTKMYEERIKELLEQIEEEQAKSAYLEIELKNTLERISHSQTSSQMQENSKVEDLQKELRKIKEEYKSKIKQLEESRSMQENSKVEELQKELRKIKEESRIKIKQLEESRFVQENNKVEELQKELRKLKEESKSKIRQLEDSRFVQMQENGKADDTERKFHKIKEESRSQIQHLEAKNSELLNEKELIYAELKSMKEKTLHEAKNRKSREDEIIKLKKALSENNAELERGTSMIRTTPGGGAFYLPQTVKSRENMMSKIFEGVGLKSIIALLRSEDLDVQIHAVRVVANLAAEDDNQEKIVEEGGLDALLSLLETSENSTTIHRVTAGAIANLAMNESNQGVILKKGGVRLLANVAIKAEDPQTLRMTAGAIANLCGNEKLLVVLKEDGGIKALLGMIRCGHADVIAQVARGISNFAKCESRAISHGHRKGKSLLIDDGALKWMVNSSGSTAYSSAIRRHIELAFCHLAQNEENTRDIITSGGIKELVRISQESSKDDIKNLAKKALNSNPAFLKEI